MVIENVVARRCSTEDERLKQNGNKKRSQGVTHEVLVF